MIKKKTSFKQTVGCLLHTDTTDCQKRLHHFLSNCMW